MHLCLFEDARAAALFPLTRTRPAYDLHLGLRTLGQAICDAFSRPIEHPNRAETAQLEREIDWENKGHGSGTPFSWERPLRGKNAPEMLLHARPLLREVTAAENGLPVPQRLPNSADVLFVNGRLIAENGPALQQIREVLSTNDPHLFTAGEGEETTIVAAWVPSASERLPADLLEREALHPGLFSDLPQTTLTNAPLLDRLTDLLDALEPALRRDIAHRAAVLPPANAHAEADIRDGAQLIERERVFVAPGATIRAGAILSAEEGPVFIGSDAVVMEQAVVRGPAIVGPKSQIKPRAYVEKSALGFYSKAGGEVQGSVLHSLSNKAHSGYLGDSYLGRWCNLGAATTTSNLKNDYGEVSVWNGLHGEIEPSGRQFAGLFMGDHSKCGIGTTFNTGTVVDVFCNLFTPQGFPPRYVPPFSWGRPKDGFSEKGFATYHLEKALRVAETVMARRNRSLTDTQRQLLTAIAERRKGASRSSSG